MRPRRCCPSASECVTSGRERLLYLTRSTARDALGRADGRDRSAARRRSVRLAARPPTRSTRAGSRGRRRCPPARRGRRTVVPSRAAGSRTRRPSPALGVRAASSVGCEFDVEAPPAHVERDPVAGLHQPERAAGRGLRRDVQHDGPVGGAAHPAVADAHHVAHALLRAASSAAACWTPRACPGSPSARSRAAPAPSRRRRRARGRRCGRGSPRWCRRRPRGRGASAGAGRRRPA